MTEQMVIATVRAPDEVVERRAIDGAIEKVWTYERLGLFPRLVVALRDGEVVVVKGAQSG